MKKIIGSIFGIILFFLLSTFQLKSDNTKKAGLSFTSKDICASTFLSSDCVYATKKSFLIGCHGRTTRFCKGNPECPVPNE